MTELVITSVGDTWVNSARAGQNYGSARWVQAQSGTRRMLVRPHLGDIAGRTVVDAYLVGRSGGTVAQTLTVARVTERWAPGQATWTNQPAVTTAGQVAVAIPALADGETFELTGLASMLQLFADGTDYYGFRISTGYSTATQRFYSTDSGEPAWELHIELSDVPEQPTDLRPDGGAVGSSPVLAWDFDDLNGEGSEQASFRVQFDTPAVGAEPDEVSPDYDSGWVVSSDPQHFPGVGLATIGPHFWRVQIADTEANESEWSDWAEFAYVAAPTLVVDSPTGPFGDPTPTILAHLSTGTISQWQAKVTGPDRSDVRARTGLVNNDTIEWTLPLREEKLLTPTAEGGVKTRRQVLHGEGPWWLHIRAWDGVSRAVGVGEQPYIETWVPLSFDDDLGVQPPTGLLIGPTDGSPIREWSWERTEEPDAWVITINGTVVERLTSDDVTLDAGRYRWTDSGHIAGLRPQEVALHAVEGDARSAPATMSLTPPMIRGVWLIPEADGIDPIMLRGKSVDDWTPVDYRATYTTSQGQQVDITYGKPGRIGDFEGKVELPDDVWGILARVEALRQSHDRRARLVWGSHSIAVRVRDIGATASSKIRTSNLEHVVRFGFVEED